METVDVSDVWLEFFDSSEVDDSKVEPQAGAVKSNGEACNGILTSLFADDPLAKVAEGSSKVLASEANGAFLESECFASSTPDIVSRVPLLLRLFPLKRRRTFFEGHSHDTIRRRIIRCRRDTRDGRSVHSLHQ
jgi:hypothetical protein